MAEEVGTEGEQDTAIGSYQWELPAMEFEGLAESLVYGTENCPKNEVFISFWTYINGLSC